MSVPRSDIEHHMSILGQRFLNGLLSRLVCACCATPPSIFPSSDDPFRQILPPGKRQLKNQHSRGMLKARLGMNVEPMQQWLLKAPQCGEGLPKSMTVSDKARTNTPLWNGEGHF